MTPGLKSQKLAATLPQARKQTDTSPTEGQQEAGNYAKGKVSLHGLPISLENPKGSTRSGTDAGGKAWSIKMKHDYGYIKGTEGRDGDHVDVFIGPEPDVELVYVVNQHTGGKFDEHKCLLGFRSEEDARKGYLANYAKGWNGLASIYPVTIPQFKWWLANGNTKKELKDGAFAKKSEAISDDDDFWNSPPNKAGRKCPGCNELFKEVEPLPGVDMCETCERFGPTKKAIAQGDDSAFFEYMVCYNQESCDSGEIEYLSDKERKRLEREWTSLDPAVKLRYHRKTAADDRRPSVAVDLDGTLAEDLDDFDPAVIGDPRTGAKKWMDAFDSAGAKVIVHTCRGDNKITAAWLDKHDIPFDHINVNPDQPPGTSDKIFADVYWDNRAIDASGPLHKSAPEVLARLTSKVAASKVTLQDLHATLDCIPASVKRDNR